MRPLGERFRGFTAGDAPADIIRRAQNGSLTFDRLDPDDLPLYRLYAGYIRHYLD